MTPEFKATLDLIGNILLALLFAVLLLSYFVQRQIIRNNNKKLRKKNSRIKIQSDIITADIELIKKRDEKISKYEFVMAISDDISREMFLENERLQHEVATLKAKLYHKKRPTNETV